MKSFTLFFSFAALAAALLFGCAPSPVGSYQSAATYDRVLFSDTAKEAFCFQGPERNPVVVIHGFLGAKLGNAKSCEMVWGKFSARPPAAAELQQLAHPMILGRPLREIPTALVPLSILDEADVEVGMFNFTFPGYRTAIDQLVKAGYVDANKPLPKDRKYADLFSFAYDWRRDLPETAERLHRFLLKKREELQKIYEREYGLKDYDVQFDIVAHSMGGLVARYYLMYGDRDLPEDPAKVPVPDWSGAKLVDKVIVAGTPNDGYLDTLTEMVEGLKMVAGAPVYPSGIISTFPSYYQMLPGAGGGEAVVKGDDSGKTLDLFDYGVWVMFRWGLANPAADVQLKLLLPGFYTAAERRVVALDHLKKCLARARQFRAALAVPSRPPDDVMLFLFAGDAVETAYRVEVDPRSGKLTPAGFSAGDGKVLATSARFDRTRRGAGLPFSQSPIYWQGVDHVAAAHMGLFSSNDFWRNVRYYLLQFPTVAQRERYQLNR